MATRDGAIARVTRFFDDGGFRERLAGLVAIPSTSQDPGHEADVQRYLDGAIRPWLERMGFTVAIHPNPHSGFGPILTAERLEDPSRPTIMTYGHGDTVRGLDDQWRAGLDPWRLTEEADRWYGRGSADNKGQHALNFSALEAVLAEREGKLGFNLKLVLETCEERGSIGLRDFVAAHKDALAADVLIASDGPRVMPEVPTIATGTRGTYHFDLVVDLRPGGVHSGHWGGLTTDPAVVLTHALGTIIDRRGKILVRDWLPRNGLPASVRSVLAGCEVGGGGDAASIDPDWGEPDRGREDLRLEQLHRAGDGVRPAGKSGERGGAECARALPDPLHGGHRSRQLRARTAPASRCRGVCRCADREPRHPHAGEPHRSGASLGALDRRLDGADAGAACAGDPEFVGRSAGRCVRRSPRRGADLGAAQLQRLQAARTGRALPDRPGT
jgi:Peptidase family M20/M25/M40